MERHKSGPETAAQNSGSAGHILGNGPASVVLYLGCIVEEILNTNIILTLMGSNFISLMGHTEVHVVAKISRSSEGKAVECFVHVNFT